MMCVSAVALLLHQGVEGCDRPESQAKLWAYLGAGYAER